MRAATVFVVLSGVAASVSAGSIHRRQYPDCANPCIQNAQVGTCDPDDLGCLCKSAAFINGTTQCIIASCSASDATLAESVARGFCETVGVTLTSAPSGQPTPSPSSTSGSGASTTNSSGGDSSNSNTNSNTNTSTSPSPTPSSSTTSTPPAPPASSTPAGGAMTHGANTLLALGAVALGALML